MAQWLQIKQQRSPTPGTTHNATSVNSETWEVYHDINETARIHLDIEDTFNASGRVMC